MKKEHTAIQQRQPRRSDRDSLQQQQEARIRTVLTTIAASIAVFLKSSYWLAIEAILLTPSETA